jgi:putative redox protein
MSHATEMEMEITFPGGARVDAAFDGFVIKTDQSPEDGGEGSAPAPFSLFLASFGTCAGIYVLSFCQQRAIPADDIRIRQRIEHDPQTRMVRRISLDILLPPGFPAKYARALVKSAKLCGVKKHLDQPPEFIVEAHVA